MLDEAFILVCIVILRKKTNYDINFGVDLDDKKCVLKRDSTEIPVALKQCLNSGHTRHHEKLFLFSGLY